MRASRILSLVAVVAGGGGLALHCTTGGLDDYSAGWSKDGGGADGGDACAPTCHPGACGGSNACGGTCGCASNELCTDAGACESCNWPSPTLDIKGGGGNFYYDRSRRLIYVSGGIVTTDGGLPTEATLQIVDPCHGNIVKEIDPIVIGNESPGAVYDIVAPGPDKLMMRSFIGASAMWARFDRNTETFDLLATANNAPPTATQWSTASGGSGLTFGSGYTDPSASPWIVPVTADGQNCGGAIVSFPGLSPGSRGRGIAALGNDVWQTLQTGVGQPDEGVRIAHYDATKCATTAPCTCVPVDVSPPFTFVFDKVQYKQLFGFNFSAHVFGDVLYVPGAAPNPSAPGDYVAFVLAYDTKQKQWLAPYTYQYGANLEGVLGLATDGKYLYGTGGRGTTLTGNLRDGEALVFTIPLPFPTAGPVPGTVMPIPSLRIGWSIDVDGETLFATGGGATSDKLVKCTKQACP